MHKRWKKLWLSDTVQPKKKDLTGSVATVNSEALTVVPVASATEALTGKMAGVQITTTEGSPDAEMKIRVRGGGSITGDNTHYLLSTVFLSNPFLIFRHQTLKT